MRIAIILLVLMTSALGGYAVFNIDREPPSKFQTDSRAFVAAAKAFK